MGTQCPWTHLTPSALFPCLWLPLPFLLSFCIQRLTKFAFSFGWLISLNIMPSSFIQTVANVRFFSIWKWIIFHYVCAYQHFLFCYVPPWKDKQMIPLSWLLWIMLQRIQRYRHSTICLFHYLWTYTEKRDCWIR